MAQDPVADYFSMAPLGWPTNWKKLPYLIKSFPLTCT